jgi:predicted secreted protein
MTRSRASLRLLVAVGVVAVAAGCASIPGAADRDLTVSEGATFTVSLDRRAGTGYGWSVDGAEGTVALMGRSVERDVSMPGTPEREVFVFLAKRSGTARLSFTYGRPGVQSSPPPAQAYRVQVIRC